MYLHNILLLLSWPLTILVSWLIVRYVLTAFEKRQKKEAEKAGQIS